MSIRRDTQISASALAMAREAVAQAVNLGFKAAAIGDAASADALARLDRQTSEVRNQETAKLLAQSIHAMQSRDFAKGEALALQALERDDKLGVAWHVLGIAREKIGDFAGSMRCYDAALKLLPDHGPVAGDLGRLAFRMDMPEIAAKFFMHYLVAKPGDLEGVNNLACALRDLNRCEEAIEVLRPAINEYPEQPLLWNTLGTVMCSLGDGKTAVTFFDETLRLAPEFGKAYHNRSYAKLDLGDVEGALEDCDRAIAVAESAEDLATMQFGRATILLALGRVEEGWKTYEARFSKDLIEAPRFTIDEPRWTPGMDLAGQVPDDLRRAGPWRRGDVRQHAARHRPGPWSGRQAHGRGRASAGPAVQALLPGRHGRPPPHRVLRRPRLSRRAGDRGLERHRPVGPDGRVS
jgi:tetratricopeptide (TPR) repeat protein